MIFGLIALLILALPHDAMAWGAGIHLTLGTAVLDNLSLIRPSVAAVIAAYPYDFLYGCIAADITIGKKFTHFLEHCHRWRIGVRVLEAASSPSRKACAYGYLSHLAADTVAHNYYVPYKIMRSFSTLTLKHTYWEMRFENFVDDEIWDVGRKVAAEHFSSNDALLRNVVSETLFSFGTNKRIFNSILLVSRLDKWRQVLKTLTGSSRYALEETDRDHYMGLAREAVFDFLLNEENAACFLADPTGEKALKTAEAVRKNLRFLYRTGKLSADQALEQLDGMKEKLRLSINTPGDLMEVLSSDQSSQRRVISRL